MANTNDEPAGVTSDSSDDSTLNIRGNVLQITAQQQLPKWLRALRIPLQQLGALYNQYGSVPAAIFGLISLYILNGIIDVVGFVAGAFLAAFDILVGLTVAARRALVGVFGPIGVDLLGVGSELQRVLLDVVARSGPFAPIVAGIVAVVILYGLYRLGVALLGEVPGGSTLVDLLRLR